MDAVLRMPFVSIGITLPWRRILSGVLLAVCCLALYVFGRYQLSGCEELTAGRVISHQIVVPDHRIYPKNDISSVKETAANLLPALPEKVYEEAEVPYVLPEMTVETVTEDMPVEALGEELTVLAEENAAVVEDEVRVERIELSGFICDENGYIVDYTDAVVTTDGILVIPSDARCRGIVNGALDGLGPDIMEIYIPANINYIEPGAFDNFASLFYIEVAGDNAYYYSSEGILYTRSGEVYAYPKGRPAESMNIS